MNTIQFKFWKLAGFTVLFLIIVTESCTTIYFDQPQPVHARNLRKVPKEFQGEWTRHKNNDSTFIEITNKSYHNIEFSGYRIPMSRFNKSKTYKIVDRKIHNLKEPEIRYTPYRIVNDTILFSEFREQLITLSDSVLLRPAKDCFVLNIKKNPGWEIFLIYKRPDGVICIDYPTKEDLYNLIPQKIVSVIDSTRKDTVVFNGKFKSGQIKKILHDDESCTVISLNPDSTLNNLDDKK
jgi:hypothetical protein